MSYPNFVELAARVRAICLEAFTTSDASSDPFFTGEAFPYFVVRIGEFTTGSPDGDDSEELDVIVVDVIIRHVVGHITQGYKGEPVETLYTQMPLLMQTFNERTLLQSAGTYVAAMTDLTEARFIRGMGFRTIESSGIGVLQVGTEHTVRCEFEYLNDQDYL